MFSSLCALGMSRSATIVIAYLMKSRGMSLKDSLALVKSRRPIVRPNDKFMKQLREYEIWLQSQQSLDQKTSS